MWKSSVCTNPLWSISLFKTSHQCLLFAGWLWRYHHCQSSNFHSEMIPTFLSSSSLRWISAWRLEFSFSNFSILKTSRHWRYAPIWLTTKVHLLARWTLCFILSLAFVGIFAPYPYENRTCSAVSSFSETSAACITTSSSSYVKCKMTIDEMPHPRNVTKPAIPLYLLTRKSVH